MLPSSLRWGLYLEATETNVRNVEGHCKKPQCIDFYLGRCALLEILQSVCPS